MMDPNLDPQKIFDNMMRPARFILWQNIAWGVLLLFFMVGIAAGYQAASFGLIIMALVWTCMEIAGRAFAAISGFKALKELEALNKRMSEDLMKDLTDESETKDDDKGAN